MVFTATSQSGDTVVGLPRIIMLIIMQICSLGTVILFMNGKVAEARALQLDLLPLINALFCEVNPIPVKAAVSAMGYCENYLRLPLTPMEKANEEKLLGLMKEQGII